METKLNQLLLLCSTLACPQIFALPRSYHSGNNGYHTYNPGEKEGYPLTVFLIIAFILITVYIYSSWRKKKR